MKRAWTILGFLPLRSGVATPSANLARIAGPGQVRFVESHFQLALEGRPYSPAELSMDVSGQEFRCGGLGLELRKLIQIPVIDFFNRLLENPRRQGHINDDIVFVKLLAGKLGINDVGGAMQILRRAKHLSL